MPQDRIRFFSTPDKVFRYFATVRVDGTVYMRAQDFIRSLTPGELQPKQYGLDRYEEVLPAQAAMAGQDKELFAYDSEGNLLSKSGLISFSEYLFFLSVLSTPKRQFELAFKMVDLDGNGTVDLDEFSKVQHAIISKTPAGKRLHGHDSEMRGSTDLQRSQLLQRFFGPKGDRSVDFKTFSVFVDELQDTVLHLDFLIHNHKMKDRKYISEEGLARMLLKYAKIKREERGGYYERVAANFPPGSSPGISYADTARFFEFLTNIDDVQSAFRLYDAAGASITESKKGKIELVSCGCFALPTRMLYCRVESDGSGQP